ncbi:MAG: DNA recombination protein RmuC [Akkermansia sp.]|nr:DNA recombination protein RmuC [Akkermansia sp.]
MNISQEELMWAGAVGAAAALVLGALLGYGLARYRSVRRIAGLEAELRTLQGARAEVQGQFRALAAEVLEHSAQGLHRSNAEQMSAVLAPLREQLLGLNRAVADTRAAGADNTASVREMVRLLLGRAEEIGRDASNLTRALKGDSKVQGDWGEAVLERLFESAGMQSGSHYEMQKSYDTPQGRLRPDAVVHLPQGMSMIVDSKVSLTAYVNLVAAEDEATRASATRAHLNSVRAHVSELAGKHYERLEPGSPDFVLMFIPNEGAYIAAVQSAPELLATAMRRKVLILSPANLMMALHLARLLWQRDTQQKNVQIIVERATLLYDKFAHFQESFDAVHKALETATTACEEARSRLYSGKGNYRSQVEKLRELGIK